MHRKGGTTVLSISLCLTVSKTSLVFRNRSGIEKCLWRSGGVSRFFDDFFSVTVPKKILES